MDNGGLVVVVVHYSWNTQWKIDAYCKKEISISELKAYLPKGYLQMMYNQRVNHQLPEWSSVFLLEVLKQI